MESYDLIKYKFEMGVYSLEQMYEFVKQNLITEYDFHNITSYNYQGIKNVGLINQSHICLTNCFVSRTFQLS